VPQLPIRPIARHARCRTTAVAAAACLTVLLGACGQDQDSAGPEREVTAQQIQQPQYFHEGDYLGQRVTVSAEVTEVLGPRNFQLEARGYGDESLLVQTAVPTEVQPGQVLQVTGTVGQFHIVAANEAQYMQNDRYEKYETEAYLYDATADTVAG
jgi:hypothetical protein